MTQFSNLMNRICDEAIDIYETVTLRPDLVPEEADLNEWAADIFNELHDMTILLEERAKR